MLNSITIKNFKAIGENELTLNNLASVNYLVGPNGSGKSSVLECVEYFIDSDKVSSLITDNRNYKRDFKAVAVFRIHPSACHVKPRNHIDVDIGEFKEEFFLLKNIVTYQNNYLINSLKQRLIPFLIQQRLPDSQDGYQGHSRNYNLITPENNPELLYEILILNILKIKCNEIPRVDFKKNALTQLERDELLEILKNIGGFNLETNIKFIYVDGNVLILSDLENTPIPIETLSDGQKVIIKFFFLLKNDPSINTILIDEPETGLHPQVQKMLPKFFAQFPETQFFVATHSPFIISASSEFKETQKVYLIEGGKCLNPEGSSGYEARMEGNKLLGAGLDDFMDEIIICEGSQLSERSCEFDANVYNTIFSSEGIYFVSASGGDINKNIHIAKKVADKVFTNKVNKVLKDSDLLSDSDKNSKIKEFQKDGLKLIYLNKQCIEAYLLDLEVVNLFFKEYQKSEEFNNSFKPSEFISTKNTQHIISYKLINLIRNEFHSLTSINKKNNEIYLELAKLINPIDTPTIYEELHDCIFLR